MLPQTATVANKQESEKLSDQELLRYYSEKWKDYTDGAQYVNKLFNYLNKHWVKREKDEGRKEVYTVYTVSWMGSVDMPPGFFAHISLRM